MYEKKMVQALLKQFDKTEAHSTVKASEKFDKVGISMMKKQDEKETSDFMQISEEE